jgi:hypothetical protein
MGTESLPLDSNTMSGRSDFTDDEWKALTEAPLLVTVTMFAAGQHGPISAVKESAAGVLAITRPGNRGAASALIAEIAPEAQSKQASHDAEHHKGPNLDAVVAACIADLEPAAAALRKLPADESQGVGSWLVDIAAAVAGASKGVSERESQTVAKIAETFGVAPPASA